MATINLHAHAHNVYPAASTVAHALLDACDVLRRYREGRLSNQELANLAGRARVEFTGCVASVPGAIQELLLRDLDAAYDALREDVEAAA